MTTTMKFNALDLARGWLSVALAAPDDPEVPRLYRAVCVEVFDAGVRVVATDSYVLLHAWVPALGEDSDDAPDLAEKASAMYVACDEHRRGAGLLAHLWKLTTAKEAPQYDVALVFDVEVPESDDGPVTLAGFEREHIMIEHPEHERVFLPLYEGEWVEWRPLALGFNAKSAPSVALNPEILGRLVKLARWNAGPMCWTWGGKDKPASVSIGHVSGIVMPLTEKAVS